MKLSSKEKRSIFLERMIRYPNNPVSGFGWLTGYSQDVNSNPRIVLGYWMEESSRIFDFMGKEQ
jgi:hypothetical protein